MYYTWQNLTWLFFHKLSLNQNSSKKEYYEKFINTFKVIIPCSICRNHFLEMLNNDKNNIKRNVKQNNLFNLTIDLHNSVNKRLYKNTWNYNYGKKHYENTYLTYDLIRRFLNSYIFFNYKKGPIKTINLIEMIKCFSHIFPRPKIREKLINFQNNMELNRDNLYKWIQAYLYILKNEMR